MDLLDSTLADEPTVMFASTKHHGGSGGGADPNLGPAKAWTVSMILSA